MAVVPWTAVSTPLDGGAVKLVKWTGLGASDTGQPFVVANYNDKTVSLVGTLGSGITIQGSNDPEASYYHTLNDPQGNALSAITTAKTEAILEHTYLLRPSCAAGVSDATVWLLLASAR